MPDKIPNVQLRAWCNEHLLTRAEMAEQVTTTPVGITERLTCNEEHIRRWEAGEVSWPQSSYRLALTQLTGLQPHDLGFRQNRRGEPRLIEATVTPVDALQAEADLYGTMELAQQLQASDVGNGTLEALAEAVDLLCRAYPIVPTATLRDRTQKRLAQVSRLLSGPITLEQHRELLVITGWLTALLGCVHHDLGEREEAETARRTAYEMGRQIGHGELMGWAYEMSAWFALVEGRYEDVVSAARIGQAAAGQSNAMVQLTLQEARGLARLGYRREADKALTRGAETLAKLPIPGTPTTTSSSITPNGSSMPPRSTPGSKTTTAPKNTPAKHTDPHSPDGTSNAPM
ncbi:hypothetical protein ACOZ38_36325 [Sphaerisporangium viridialbum]|uniref:hypothetical protein n=1 Tax=Sphaerisporangium viridialbum TaxID=46189 RepID=UPI003C717095